MDPKKFYDIHFHIMDLSHANITAFTDRFIKNETLIKKFIKNYLPFFKKIFYSFLIFLVGPFIRYSYLAKKLSNFINKQTKVRNLLSFMETSVMYDFLIIDYFLKNNHQENKALIKSDNTFSVGENDYNKIILCPLIMDFGYPNLDNGDIFYNIPPKKPIVSQIKDLFSAIRTYYSNELEIVERNGKIKKFNVIETEFNKENKLFEIYPFMGINPINYSFDEIKLMLEKYFADFSKEDTKETRYELLYKALGNFNGDLDDLENSKNMFAGIKLYPPLGFDPWPDIERNKVELIYQNCVDKNIPIITHCSTGGFVADKDHKEKYTNPNNKWRAVLTDERFKKLKIDFAHMGADDPNWTETIIQYALNEELNVYTDFSSLADEPQFYSELKNQINKADSRFRNKIIYGSDFMINLLKVNSLNEYMEYFFKTDKLSDAEKHLFANTNPEEFLFGK